MSISRIREARQLSGASAAVLRAAGFPPVRIEATTEGVRRIEFMTANPRGAAAEESSAHQAVLRRAAALLGRYFRGRRVDFRSLPLDLSKVSPFQRDVYGILKAIPHGEVRSYGWIASKMGKPRACRAVGRAMRSNPLPIVLPCHRVVASNGLGGFSCGLDIKRRLLELEGSDFSFEKR